MAEAARCHDCGVEAGALHQPGCDVERCPRCGGQLLSCGHPAPNLEDRLAWTGSWPGVEDCRRLGLYAKEGPGGWVPCAADDSGATEDLNRLYSDCRWNAQERCFELRNP